MNWSHEITRVAKPALLTCSSDRDLWARCAVNSFTPVAVAVAELAKQLRLGTGPVATRSEALTKTIGIVAAAIATPAFARPFDPEVGALRVETRAAQSGFLPPMVAIRLPRARANRDITVPIGTSVASAISR